MLKLGPGYHSESAPVSRALSNELHILLLDLEEKIPGRVPRRMTRVECPRHRDTTPNPRAGRGDWERPVRSYPV